MSLINAISISSSDRLAPLPIGRVRVKPRRACLDTRARSSIISARWDLLKKFSGLKTYIAQPAASHRAGIVGARAGARAPNSRGLCSARDRLILLPLEELPEQRLSVLGFCGRPHLVFAQELIEAAACIGGSHGAAVPIEPFLRRFEPRPAGQGGIERHLLPFRMERRLLQSRGLF